MFRKADKIKPGAFAALERKALQLVGGPSSPPTPAGRSAYGVLVADGKADIFLTYCTNALAAQKEHAGQQIVALPDALAVGADYGLTVTSERFARCLPLRPVRAFVAGPAYPREPRILCTEPDSVGEMAMKISARNQLKGKITEVKKGTTTAHVQIDIGGKVITASITNDSVDRLGLAAGKDAYAVIKASDVMVAVD